MALLTIIDAARRFVDKPKKKKWMQGAVPKAHEGKFTAKAERAGKSVREYAEEEKGAGGTLGKEANLALTFEKEAGKRKGKRLRDHYKRKG